MMVKIFIFEIKTHAKHSLLLAKEILLQQLDTRIKNWIFGFKKFHVIWIYIKGACFCPELMKKKIFQNQWYAFFFQEMSNSKVQENLPLRRKYQKIFCFSYLLQI